MFIEKPDSGNLKTSLFIKNSGTTRLTSSISLLPSLHELAVYDSTLKLETSLSVANFLGDGKGKVHITNSATLQISSFVDALTGSWCSFEVDQGSKLDFIGSSALYVTGESPSLVVKGEVTATTLHLGTHGSMVLKPSGSLQLTNIQSEEFSNITIETGANLNSVGSIMDSITIGYSASLIFNEENIYINAKHFTMNPKARLDLNMDIKNLTIVAEDITIEDEAMLSTSGGGSLAGAGVCGSGQGSSHGGQGGGSTGTIYGSTTLPVEFGSGCGSSRGGGMIKLIASGTVRLDGTLQSNGVGGSTSGGSSGGSIDLSAKELIGHGHLEVNGGESSSAGGGGGGRISVRSNDISGFHGYHTSYGGSGSTGNGAAGTIYIEYVQSGNTLQVVEIDNNNKKTYVYTVITDVINLSELRITGNNLVHFDDSLANINIETIDGDHKGTLIVKATQTMDIATAYGTQHPYSLKCNLNVEGNVKLPARLLIEDDDILDDAVNLYVTGTVTGLRNLVVGAGGVVEYSKTSQSGLSASSVGNQGVLSLTTLDVATYGRMILGTDSEEEFTVNVLQDINVKYKGDLDGSKLSIDTQNLQVAFAGSLKVDKQGHDSGLGQGSGNSGSGASYGGTGGTSGSNSDPAVDYYDDLFNPILYGSGGGNTTSGGVGGHGGGILVITVSNLLTLHGDISSNGEAGITSGGGGSGGTVAVTTNDVIGGGSISSKGGDSSSTGGGGGGGRIKFVVNGDMNYTGSYNVHGGSAMQGQGGGSGTVYVESTVASLPVRKVFTNNDGITGLTLAATVIDLPGITEKTVDELTIGDQVSLHVNTPHLHFTAKTLLCGQDSFLYVEDDVTFSGDTGRASTQITCSLVLSERSDMKLPETVQLLGPSNAFDGKCFEILISAL